MKTILESFQKFNVTLVTCSAADFEKVSFGDYIYDEFYTEMRDNQFFFNIPSYHKTFAEQVASAGDMLSFLKDALVYCPETNLHPKHQVESIQVAIRQIIEQDYHTIIFTNSPYILQGVINIMEKELQEHQSKINHIHGKGLDDSIIWEDTNKDYREAFSEFAKPFREIIWN